MDIKDFADELADISIAGVTTVLGGVPNELKPAELPAQWVDMPSAIVEPGNQYSTFTASGARYTAVLRIAVAQVGIGLPDEHRDDVLEMAAEVIKWAAGTPYSAEVLTAPRIPVGNQEYRGVTARIIAEEVVL